MPKFLCVVLIVLGLVMTCKATTYTVGDSSGWDISSEFVPWTAGKNFTVGDVLSFQYNSYHSVYEVSKDDYNGCNVSNPLKANTGGNTTVTLSAPGERYFVCGNRLHCLGGMKLKVNVAGEEANSPVSSPTGSPSSLPTPSNKNNRPLSRIPTSTGHVYGGWVSHLSYSCLGFLVSMFVIVA